VGSNHGSNLRLRPPRAGCESPFVVVVVSSGVNLKVVIGGWIYISVSIAGRYRFSEGGGQ